MGSPEHGEVVDFGSLQQGAARRRWATSSLMRGLVFRGLDHPTQPCTFDRLYPLRVGEPFGLVLVHEGRHLSRASSAIGQHELEVPHPLASPDVGGFHRHAQRTGHQAAGHPLLFAPHRASLANPSRARRARPEAGHWPVATVAHMGEPFGDVRLAVVDVETTGIRANEDRIIEVAVIDMDGSGVEHGRWSTLVRPDDRPLEGRLEAVADAPTFQQIAGDLIERLTQGLITGHNARFDLRLLDAEATAKVAVALLDRAAGWGRTDIEPLCGGRPGGSERRVLGRFAAA